MSEVPRYFAEMYRAAAKEHMDDARLLYRSDRYALSLYVAGLAVECTLRAYRVRRDPQFDARHDLRDLHKLAAFNLVIPEKRSREVNAAMSEIVTLWRNDHRYHSNESLRQDLKKRRLVGGIKGDPLKTLCARAVDAAITVVTSGEAQWTRI